MFHSYISSWAVRNVIVENVKFHLWSHWAVYNLSSKYTSGSIVGYPRDEGGWSAPRWRQAFHMVPELIVKFLNYKVFRSTISHQALILLFFASLSSHLFIAVPSCPLFFYIHFPLCNTFPPYLSPPPNTGTYVYSSQPFFSSLTTSDWSL